MQKAIEAYEALNSGESQEQPVVKQPTQPKPNTVPEEYESDPIPF